ncbi:MAG: BatA and WFA domain-containing protein [Candidatus Altiarchaeota archaeon]|nr:BatA and WFA domain-containing protein [Candidatus Altiarchaeota archaeon]
MALPASIPTPNGFINEAALAAIALVIPLIILYLLKPKPKRIKFPTVRFIKNAENSRRFSSILNRFIRDPLLLMQILLIALLAIAMANPYFDKERTTTENTAIALVIDASASMKATDVAPSRFEAAVAGAREVVSYAGDGSAISIILAENIPITVLSGGSKTRALELLGRINCGDTPSNTGDAMLLARDLLSSSPLKKTAYLFSDFAKSESDPLAARKVLLLNGIDVRYIALNDGASNAGITEIDARRASMNRNILYMTYKLRSLDAESREITRRIYVNNILASTQSSVLKPMAEELFYVNYTISQDPQLITVELSGAGALPADDKAYAVVPELRSYNTMILTGKDADRYTVYALEAQTNNRIRTAEPPVLPSLPEYDSVIIGQVKADSILPGTFRDIKNYVESGKTLIVIASPELSAMEDENLKGLLPVRLKELVSLERAVSTSSHEILNDVSLANTAVKRYYTAEAKDNATVIAETEGNPLIAYWNVGKGKVVYMGINPANEWSSFQYSSSFPIFWAQLIEYINRREGAIKNLNHKTGGYIILQSEADVTNPEGKTTRSKSIFLDRTGFYSINTPETNDRVAVNLEDEDESDIRTAYQDKEAFIPPAEQEKKTREELMAYIIALALALLFAEMYVYRRRGRL